MKPRSDNRAPGALRPVRFHKDFQLNPTGSVAVSFGNTRVLCAVNVTPGVPRWMMEKGVPGGWLTSEYQMLPGATPERQARESGRSGPSGRSQEIQRLVGRSLRAILDLKKIGQRTISVDCDVLDADGGTRCAAITGSSVALELALRKLFTRGDISTWPLREHVAAVSVGMVDGQPLLDLCYTEDSTAEVDMNVVMTAGGKFVEIQGTAEGEPFSHDDMQAMLKLAETGIQELFALQRQALGNPA